MLIQFSVGNYRSFKETVTLNMLAAPRITSKPKHLDENNLFTAGDDLSLLVSAAIYGANASGKSNLIRALSFMIGFVLRSSRETQFTELIGVESFRLSTETEDRPSFFEIVFLLGGVQYRYGFEATAERVVGEWLYTSSSARESRLFERDADTIRVNPRTFREGKGLEERTRPNALFLSVVAQFNGPLATIIVEWFAKLVVNMGVNDKTDMRNMLRQLETPSFKDNIEAFIRKLDVGIDGLKVEYPPEEDAVLNTADSGTPDSRSRVRIRVLPSVRTIHRKYDADGQMAGETLFSVAQHESAGTQRLFTLAYPLLNTLNEGGILIIDELDARIHPNLVIELIRLFHSKETNPHHAQLIFTTHNTNLLSAQLFRRDQIWFLEKSRHGASDLYSLVEYRLQGKGVRNDASYEKDYITGRYGAIPFIGDLSSAFGDNDEQEAGAD